MSTVLPGFGFCHTGGGQALRGKQWYTIKRNFYLKASNVPLLVFGAFFFCFLL
jgi:hypothetical protein